MTAVVGDARDPPGRTTRHASRHARSRSSRSIRWWSGPNSSTWVLRQVEQEESVLGASST
ncbi:hypothetical protein IOD16_35800 [Saccharothrix sp. 6-C]|uniref:hypothetical protein n=1 Tax=Saccharothrix sp. 6-C TaxID=2781735 RepID=UPI0019177D52|nr:hypothetical protein [Saccharothrix sp. 6-C]QQQ76327.1 hypothetical protein IOD16_35800 [Saccharothrix sp. 6-C]